MDNSAIKFRAEMAYFIDNLQIGTQGSAVAAIAAMMLSTCVAHPEWAVWWDKELKANGIKIGSDLLTEILPIALESVRG